jgi:hypothetical protein
MPCAGGLTGIYFTNLGYQILKIRVITYPLTASPKFPNTIGGKPKAKPLGPHIDDHGGGLSQKIEP